MFSNIAGVGALGGRIREELALVLTSSTFGNIAGVGTLGGRTRGVKTTGGLTLCGHSFEQCPSSPRVLHVIKTSSQSVAPGW